jgi:hypothetical protein
MDSFAPLVVNVFVIHNAVRFYVFTLIDFCCCFAAAAFDCTTVAQDGDWPFSADHCRNDFVTCSNGQAVRRLCPADLVFDPINHVCDRKQSIVACGGVADGLLIFVVSLFHFFTVIATTESSVTFNCPSANGAFPHPSLLCSPDYYVCIANKPVQKFCPIGKIFDATTGQCSQNVAGCCEFILMLIFTVFIDYHMLLQHSIVIHARTACTLMDAPVTFGGVGVVAHRNTLV